MLLLVFGRVVGSGELEVFTQTQRVRFEGKLGRIVRSGELEEIRFV